MVFTRCTHKATYTFSVQQQYINECKQKFAFSVRQMKTCFCTEMCRLYILYHALGTWTKVCGHPNTTPMMLQRIKDPPLFPPLSFIHPRPKHKNIKSAAPGIKSSQHLCSLLSALLLSLSFSLSCSHPLLSLSFSLTHSLSL